MSPFERHFDESYFNLGLRFPVFVLAAELVARIKQPDLFMRYDMNPDRYLEPARAEVAAFMTLLTTKDENYG